MNESSGDSSRSTATASRTASSTLTSIMRPGQCVLGKGTGKSLLACDLLATDEALNRDADGPVDVSRRNVVS